MAFRSATQRIKHIDTTRVREATTSTTRAPQKEKSRAKAPTRKGGLRVLRFPVPLLYSNPVLPPSTLDGRSWLASQTYHCAASPDDDTSAQVKMSHPQLLVPLSQEINLKKNSSVDGGDLRFNVFSSSRFASAGRYRWKIEKNPQIRTEYFLKSIGGLRKLEPVENGSVRSISQ